MRIALLTNDAPPQVGGITNYLAGLVTSTLETVEWMVWSTVPDTDTTSWHCLSEFVDTGRHLGARKGDQFPLWRKVNSLLWRWNKRREAENLISRIRDQFAPQIILVARWCEDGHHWCRACNRWDVPYAVIGHGLEFRAEHPRFPWNVAAGIHRDLARVTHGFANSEATRQLMLSRGLDKERSSVLPPGLMSEPLGSGGTTDRQGQGLRRFVLCLGRLVFRKGFDLGIAAYETVADEFPDVDLVIAGDGPEREALESQIQSSKFCSRINLVGEVSEEEKSKLLAQCDVFLMPNRPVEGDMEGFGIVFLEAGWNRKPVIGGNNGGVPEAIDDGKTGYCVNSPDIGCISNALRSLLASEERRRDFGEAAFERVNEGFLWSSLGTQFVTAIESACSSDSK